MFKVTKRCFWIYKGALRLEKQSDVTLSMHMGIFPVSIRTIPPGSDLSALKSSHSISVCSQRIFLTSTNMQGSSVTFAF